jgi:hypothetical protein
MRGAGIVFPYFPLWGQVVYLIMTKKLRHIMENSMNIKIFWEKCHEFVVEEEDAFFLEAGPDEAATKILPLLSPSEKIKFEQMKDIYIAKATRGIVHEGCYYFLISRGAHTIKFESVALLTSDLSARGGKAKALPDVSISSIEDIDSVNPAKY